MVLDEFCVMFFIIQVAFACQLDQQNRDCIDIRQLRRYFIQDLFQWTDERGLPQQASGRPVLPEVDAPHLD
jgi:hypothetical protein